MFLDSDLCAALVIFLGLMCGLVFALGLALSKTQ